MINAETRRYSYFTLGSFDEYGQQTLSDTPTGEVKMAISPSSYSVQNNINYVDCKYIGLTLNNEVNDSWVIVYGDKELKVLYVNKFGRFNQVFLGEM